MKLIKGALVLYDDTTECLALVEIIHQHFPEIIVEKKPLNNHENIDIANLSDIEIVIFDSRIVLRNHLILAEEFANLSIPVIYITGHEKLEVKSLKIRKSINYLIKPYHIMDLVQIIKRIEKESNKKTKKTRLSNASSVLMSDGTILPISKNKRKEFINRLNVL